MHRLAIALLSAGCLACGKTDTAAKPPVRTQREKDSALARSQIPGAGGVGAALRASDTVSAHIRATDTVAP
jgi:hypothetical protein